MIGIKQSIWGWKNTINEPIIYALVSFLLGEWTPWKRNILTFNKVVKNLAKAHWTIYNKNSNCLFYGIQRLSRCIN